MLYSNIMYADILDRSSIDPIDKFISYWQGQEGGQERANYQNFLLNLCKTLGLPTPEASSYNPDANNYVFERIVSFREVDGTTRPGWIDLYKKGCFVLEAKQTRQKGKAIPGQPDLRFPEVEPRGRRTAVPSWDTLRVNARRQAEQYAKALPPSHGWPPFILVCDVGHCIEAFADFSGQGKNYEQFPDRNGYRIYLEDLRRPEIRDRLAAIWNDPHSLDPARRSAKVTRDVAARLAIISRRLEARSHQAETVAEFLMRCLFTMFAEDVGLLPAESFTALLARCVEDPTKFPHAVNQLWQAMNSGDYAHALEKTVPRFNGQLFAGATVLELTKDEITELHAAAKADWRQVEPAIFGALLEQALDEKERSRLGAHYTPRAYVERLVVVTVLEPLRQEWAQVQGAAESCRVQAEQAEAKGDRATANNKRADALTAVRAFHAKLCHTRVLDPACGTGNFLYVALELMKRLEGEVLESVLELGGQEDIDWLDRQTVDPHQFLGLEVNPRAAAIAELVIWLGYLQWHFRTKTKAPPEPILHKFGNIRQMDAVLTWDGYPLPKVETGPDGKRVETYPNARRPEWPEAEFIVGNPPFIGGKDIRARLGDSYAKALWAAHAKRVDPSADLVMYWWDRAGERLTAEETALRRFGFVTTNSITQTFSRRVVARHLEAKRPLSLLMAIPDHPWTKVVSDHASVRIAMTVATAGKHDGVLREVTGETDIDTDEPKIELSESFGRINADLTVGVDVTAATPLQSNDGLCSPGVKLHGSGFIITPERARELGLSKRPGLERHIRHYRNGRDLTATPRGVMVIDLFGLEAEDVRQRFPEVYQHLLETVKPARQTQYDKSPTRDAKEYLDKWWIHGKPREDLRQSLSTLTKYIGTVETASHRIFQFIDESILPDNRIVCFAFNDGFHLGIFSSFIHITWTLHSGGTLEDRPIYTKSRCFDPFPFPDCPDALKAEIRAKAEDLDAHRKARQAEHPRLTLTQMYNVLELLRSGAALDKNAERINAEGLARILKELHDELDALVLRAYGWTDTPTDEQILERLVRLNAERALAEKAGRVLWLRPEYQIPRFGSDAERSRLDEERRLATEQPSLPHSDDAKSKKAAKPAFPTGNELQETIEVMSALAKATTPLTIPDLCAGFSQGRKIEKRVTLTVQALARMGHLASPDSGQSYTLQR
jgi:hypothetical protein